MGGLDPVRVFQDLAASVLAAGTAIGAFAVSSAGTAAIVGVVGSVATLVVTFLGRGNKGSLPPSGS